MILLPIIFILWLIVASDIVGAGETTINYYLAKPPQQERSNLSYHRRQLRNTNANQNRNNGLVGNIDSNTYPILYTTDITSATSTTTKLEMLEDGQRSSTAASVTTTIPTSNKMSQFNDILRIGKEIVQSQKNNNEYYNLTAIIHVGPMKTGSSGIQEALRLLKGELLQDTFELGNKFFRGPPNLFHMCFDIKSLSYNDGIDNPCNIHLLREIQSISLQRHNNIIISAEGFYRPDNDLTMLKDYFISSGWNNIIIAMYYRRYYEWILSFHNQGNKNRDISKRVSIIDYIAERRWHTEQHKEQGKWGDQYVVNVYNRYNEHFSDHLKLYNMHNISHNGDVREPIFCDAMKPHGIHSCSKLHELQKNEEGNIHKTNSHQPLVYSELSYNALQLKLWQERDDLTLADVTVLVTQRHEIQFNRSEYDFPSIGITCIPDDAYYWLLQLTLEAEEILFPEYYSQNGKYEIYDSFNRSKKSFCHIDTYATLLDENDQDSIEWRNFFQSL